MTTPFDNFSFGNPSGGQDEAIDRVNANTANTGSAAFKDKSGRTVLTNMAIDSTGRETRIGSAPTTNTGTEPVNVPSPAAPTSNTMVAGAGPTFANTPDVRSSLFQGLDRLRKATDPVEATALYDSLLQSLTAEQARFEVDAQNLAQSKYGVPTLQQNLIAARMADKSADDYRPGLGDSPITQRIVTEMRQAGESARAESVTFLRTNMGYVALSTLKQQADRELKRIEGIADTTNKLALNTQLTRETAAINLENREALGKREREERRKEELVGGYNKLNSTQIRNVSLLAGDQIGALAEGSEEKKVRIAELAFGNKDKNFVAAIQAEQPHEKLTLALQGNVHATKLVALEESERLGISIQEANTIIKNLGAKLATFNAAAVVNKQTGTEDDKAKITSALAAGRFDPNKKQSADILRINLFMQEQQKEMQNRFDNDVGTWKVEDPRLAAMISAGLAKSRKIAGKSDAKNVLASILDDGPDEQRLVMVGLFNNALDMAANRYKDSAFGQPNTIATKAMIAREGIEQKWWTRAVNAINKITNSGMADLMYPRPSTILRTADRIQATDIYKDLDKAGVIGGIGTSMINPFTTPIQIGKEVKETMFPSPNEE